MKTKLHLQQILAVVILALAAFATEAANTTYYIYDESGHVIGEYDADGNPIQEHVYLGDRPVAVVQGGNASNIDYVTTDQLNTPRAITNSSQAVVWNWASDPFGNGQPTGSLTYNLRFPGQYYDAETGHNYNYYRDYDPATGRYVESDLIGLHGGINTYAYVRDNPLFWTDRYGLCHDCGNNCLATYRKDTELNDSMHEVALSTCSAIKAGPFLVSENQCKSAANKFYDTMAQYYLRKYNRCMASCILEDFNEKEYEATH